MAEEWQGGGKGKWSWGVVEVDGSSPKEKTERKTGRKKSRARSRTRSARKVASLLPDSQAQPGRAGHGLPPRAWRGMQRSLFPTIRTPAQPFGPARPGGIRLGVPGRVEEEDGEPGGGEGGGV